MARVASKRPRPTPRPNTLERESVSFSAPTQDAKVHFDYRDKKKTLLFLEKLNENV